MNKRKSILLVFIALTITAIFHLIDIYNFNSLSPVFLRILRWIFIGSLVLFALYKRTLTTWILVSMVIGVEIGLDFPEFAKDLKVLSQIFLRLVKTIIAPILFSTLVVGIAGHSDLKQVGRMGWKSIVYFEVVTTLALIIGLIAINISQAGVGIHIPPGFHEELPATMPQTWQDVLLHIFPENIIKSMYNGDVLPIVVFSVIFGIGLAMVKEEKRQ
ncbi:MAG: cation:dicarboxylase symporter family transporter, partial [Ginsengibacter sp.]